VTIVSNTGPLIALAKADLLHLLNALFGQVEIPLAVHRELLAKTGAEAERIDAAVGDYVVVTDPATPTPQVLKVIHGLGPGEEKAIGLAFERGTGLIIDDRLGRAAAKALGLIVTGTVGVLIEAKRADLIPAVRSPLEKMQAHGYYFSDALIDAAARLAGEL